MKKILMKDAEQFRDTVSAKLCNYLYDACNEFLFEFTTPIMFSVHMNMRLEQDFFRPPQIQAASYLLYGVCCGKINRPICSCKGMVLVIPETLWHQSDVL